MTERGPEYDSEQDARAVVDRMLAAVPQDAEHVGSFPQSAAQGELDWQEFRDRVKLRRRYGTGLLWALIVQMTVVHVVFVVYLVNNGWDVPANVFMAYLGVTLGETVGLSYVVVRHLFPDPQDDR